MLLLHCAAACRGMHGFNDIYRLVPITRLISKPCLTRSVSTLTLHGRLKLISQITRVRRQPTHTRAPITPGRAERVLINNLPVAPATRSAANRGTGRGEALGERARRALRDRARKVKLNSMQLVSSCARNGEFESLSGPHGTRAWVTETDLT